MHTWGQAGKVKVNFVSGPFWRPTSKADQCGLPAEEQDQIKSSFSGDLFNQVVKFHY